MKASNELETVSEHRTWQYTDDLYLIVITMAPLQRTIVDVPLLQISKQVITRNTKIIIIRIPVHTFLLSHGTRVVVISIWRQNKIMFVLASTNIIFLSCSSSHFCIVIGFRNNSDIFHFRNSFIIFAFCAHR